MGQSYGGVCGVDALAAVSGGAHYVDSYVFIVNDNVHIFYFGHYSYGYSGGVDAAAGFGFRDALYAVYAAFVFKFGVGSFSVNHEADFLHAADSDFVNAYGFHLPTVPFRVFYVKAVHFGGKKRCLISAGAGADFYNNVFIIIGVFGEQKDLQFLFQLLYAFFCFAVFFFEQFAHFFIGFGFQHKEAVLRILFCFLIFSVAFHNRSQITLFLHQSPEPVLVGRYGRLVQFVHDFLISPKQVFQPVKHFYTIPS